MLIFVYSHF